MKHFAAMLAIFLILFPIAGCGSAGDTGNSPDAGPETSPAASEYTAVPQPADETDKNIPAATDTRGKRAINFYCPTIEESQIIEMYQELHPDFPYNIYCIIKTDEVAKKFPQFCNDDFLIIAKGH